MPTNSKGKAVAHDEQPMGIDNGEGMSTGVLIKKHQAKMAWSMAGWHGGAALYHPQGCQQCDDYVMHAVEASDLNQLNVLRKDIEHAVRDLGFLCDCYSVFSIDWRLKRMKNRLFI